MASPFETFCAAKVRGVAAAARPAQTADHLAASNRFHNLSSLGCILYAVARARIVGATGNAIRNIGAKKNN